MIAPTATADELIAYLRTTSLPTVLVEGGSDMTVFRWIEETLGTTHANMLPCSGRDNLLAIYERRAEVPRNVAYVADLDMFVVSGVPLALNGIIWTEGYCIENDAYSGGREYLTRLLSGSEAAGFERLLRALSTWFAGLIDEARAGGTPKCATHLNQLVPFGDEKLAPGFTPATVDPAIVEFVYDNHATLVRGKQLFQALERLLAAPGRPAQHRYRGLIELALKGPNRNEPMIRLLTEITTAVNA